MEMSHRATWATSRIVQGLGSVTRIIAKIRHKVSWTPGDLERFIFWWKRCCSGWRMEGVEWLRQWVFRNFPPCIFFSLLNHFYYSSWRRLKQCVDATVEDIRRRELLSEIELRIIQVQCSPPVMWVMPSRRITFPGSEAIDAPQSLKEQKSRVSVMAETIWYLGFSL